jgi:hypothetical protein
MYFYNTKLFDYHHVFLFYFYPHNYIFFYYKKIFKKMFLKRRILILVKLRFINSVHTIIVNMHSVSYHLDVQELKYKNLKSRNSILFFFSLPKVQALNLAIDVVD